MKKEIAININDYMLLEILHMLDYLCFDDIIEEKLKQFRRLMSKRVFGDLFNDLDDIEIINQEFKLKYVFKEFD